MSAQEEAVGPGGNASVTACAASLANTIIGAGILGLPYAFMHCGLPLGVLLLVGCGAACCFSLHLLALSARTSDVFPSSFYTVANASFPGCALFIDLAVAIKCFGVATSYLIVIADQMPTVMAQAGAAPRWQARELWVSLGVAIAGPLACASRLEALKLSSVLAICCVLYVALLSAVVLAFPDELACAAGTPPGSCRGTVRAAPDASAPKVLSIFIFGFTCQQNLFAVVNELARPTLGRVNRVIGAAVPLALGVYLLVALSGYLVYGTAVQPDLLLNYPADSACFLCARAGISIVVLCAYPLQAHPSRKCALTLLASIERACAQARAQAPRADARRDGLTASGTAAIGSLEATSDVRIPAVCIEEDALAKPLLSTSAPFGVAGDAAERTAGATSDRGDAPGDSGEARDWEYSWRYWVYTGLFVLCSWRIALAVHSLGTVMAVVGATGSTSVSYILPGAIYCKLHPHPHAKRNAALCMCAAGVCIIPVALHAIFTR